MPLDPNAVRVEASAASRRPDLLRARLALAEEEIEQLRAERDGMASALEELQTSTSFRLGRWLVSMAAPVRPVVRALLRTGVELSRRFPFSKRLVWALLAAAPSLKARLIRAVEGPKQNLRKTPRAPSAWAFDGDGPDEPPEPLAALGQRVLRDLQKAIE